MKTIIYLILLAIPTCLAVTLTSCSHRDITTPQGASLTETRVGGKASVTALVIAPDGQITILGDEWDGDDSLRHVTRMTNSLGLGYIYAGLAKAQSADSVTKAKSSDAVTTQRIRESATTDRAGIAADVKKTEILSAP